MASAAETQRDATRRHGVVAPAVLRRRWRSAALGLLLLAAPVRAAVLTVDDTTDPGAPGDVFLSLSEAIRLATGRLAVDALSPAEQAQVSGVPGAGASDTIGFAVNGVTLTGDGTAEILPPLSSVGDTIDGEGRVVLDGAQVDPATALYGLRITGSNNAVTGLTFDDVPGTVLLVSPSVPGGALAGTRILNNHFTGAGNDAIRLIGAALPQAGANVSGGTVDDTLIEANTIESGTSDHLVRGAATAAINIIAAYAPALGSITGAGVHGTVLRANTVRDVFFGVYVRAAAGIGTLSDNTVTGLTLADNVFERVTDGCLVASPSNISGHGVGHDNVLGDVAVVGNTFTERAPGAAPILGGAVFITGGFLDSCVDTTSTPTSLRDRTVNVAIARNTIVDRAPYGVFVLGTHSCGGAGGHVTDSTVTGVTIEDNVITNTFTGISLQGASTVETAGGLENARNVLSGVRVSGNLVTGHESAGVEILGAYSSSSGARAGSTVDNAVEDTVVSDNVFAGNKASLSVIGAINATAAVAVARNGVYGLRVTGNRITDNAVVGILLQGANGGRNGDASDNVVAAPQMTDNAFAASAGVGILAVGAFAAPGAELRENAIANPVFARNTFEDFTPAAGPDMPPGTAIMLVGDPHNAVSRARIDSNDVRRVTGFGIALSRTTGHTIAYNRVFDYGLRAFYGKKRRNALIANVFGPKPRKRRRAS
jgi:hypothetical protein